MQTFKIETLKSGVATLILISLVVGLLELLIALNLPSRGFIIAFCIAGMAVVFLLSNFLIKKFAVEKLIITIESDRIIIDTNQPENAVARIKVSFSNISSYNYNQIKGDKSIRLELVQNSPIAFSYNSSFCEELDFDSFYDTLEKAFNNYNSNIKLPVSQELELGNNTVKPGFRATDLILDESGTYNVSNPNLGTPVTTPIFKEKPFYEKKIAAFLAAIMVLGLIGFTIYLLIHGIKDKYASIFLVYSSAISFLFPFFTHRLKKS